ncbi:MAG: hypothetical protein H6729_10705 [Deltaproteobacteria bacterium]|nr:hypothetical protein [Deltaproteobacteria bacterium]
MSEGACYDAGVGVVPLLALALLGAGPAKEMVALPLQADGLPASQGFDAWKAVKQELKRARRKVGVSVKLQAQQHNLLAGPARERARDCGLAVRCLADVGKLVKADILVAGRVERDGVLLVAIDVAEGRLLKQSRSSPKLRTKGTIQQAKSATRRLTYALAARLRSGGRGDGAMVAQGDGRRRSTRRSTRRPGRHATTTSPTALAGLGGEENRSVDSAGARNGDASADGTGASSGSRSSGGSSFGSTSSNGTRDDAKENTGQGGDSTADRDPEETAMLILSAASVRNVSSVSIDGESVPFSGDGGVLWQGSPGEHRLELTLVDGRSVRENLTLQPNEERRLALDLSASMATSTTPSGNNTSSSAAAETTPAHKDEGSVVSTWWFWTVIGVVAAAGTTSAILLATQQSGGPTLPEELGSIRGTY